MDSAGFRAAGHNRRSRRAVGPHAQTLQEIVPLQEDNPPAIGPGGTVHCSLEDLARYTIFHMDKNQKAGLLKPETLAKLHTPPSDGD